MRKFLLLLFIFCFSNITIPAQTFKYIGMADGLNSRRVVSVQQGTRGYMWILTHKGVSKFDGKNFQNHVVLKDNLPMRFYPDLHRLYVDQDKALWIIGKDGFVFKYDEARETFDLVLDVNAEFNAEEEVPLSTFYFDNEKRIWFFCKEDVYVYDTKSGERFRQRHHIPLTINAMTEDIKGKMFYISTRSGIYTMELNRRKKITIKKLASPNFSSINYLYFHNKEKQLVVSTLLDGLYIYHPHVKSYTLVGYQLKDIAVNQMLDYYRSPEEILIATDGGGICKLNIQTKEFETFLGENLNRNNGMNGNIIKNMCIDSSKRIWAAVYPTGITVYSPLLPAYQWFKHIPTNSNSLVDDRVNAIMRDSDGDIWGATSNGISLYHSHTKTWSSYLSHTSGDNLNHIFISLCELNPGNILAGGYMSDLYIINKNSRAVTYGFLRNTFNDQETNRNIRALYHDNNILWVGGFYGVKAYDLTTKKFKSYRMNYPVTTITQRDKNSVWIGTINGLYYFDKARKKLFKYRLKEDDDCINTIYTLPDGSMSYVGTYGSGIYAVNNVTNKVYQYTNKNSGLVSDNIYSIIPNKYGDLIIGCENSLSYFQRHQNRFINWGKEQGLLSYSFNPNSATNTHNGTLVFGTDRGVIIIPDSVYFERHFSAQMVLNDFSIMYKPVKPLDPDSPLKEPLNETDKIQLKYNQNTFGLKVSTINYDNPSNILYSWKLEGFYDDWTPPTNDGEIRYTNLSSGNYKLKIRSILLDTHQVLEEREIQILIGRPIWLSLWAFIIYGVIIIIAFRLHTRFTILLRERQESKEKISFFVHTAHDVRTPLTLIKAPLGEVLKNEKLSEEGVANINLAIQNTDNLTELANNLLNFQEEDLYSSKVSVSKFELNDYLSNYVQHYVPHAEHLNIKLTYSSSFDKQDVWIDHNKMNSILRNILTNALKYTKPGGTVNVEAEANDKEWTVRIKDTGIGISKQDQGKLFKFLFRGYNATNQLITGSGIGLLLTYRLIRQHAGNVKFKSEENVGTIFTLTFPIQSKLYSYKVGSLIKESQISSAIDKLPALQDAPIQIDNSDNEHAPMILIVEDNPPLRTFLTNSLRGRFRVLQAANGKEGLKLAREENPDIIISDVMMPEMTGNEMCKILKNDLSTSHIPIILLTALTDSQSMLEGINAKADLYLTKPFDLTVLIAHINTVLENREILRSKFRTEQDTDADETNEPEEENGPAALDKAFMKQVNQIIHEHLGSDFNVDVLCSMMNMSRTSFYNKIKALTGIAPADYIRDIRMKEAAKLLRTRQFTIAEVADRMGFADPKYFTDTFKKFYNLTPSAYMKKLDEEQQPKEQAASTDEQETEKEKHD